MRSSFIGATLGVALAALAPRAAGALDLTGNWQGSWKCAVFTGEKSGQSQRDSTMAITQNGTLFGVVLDGGAPYTGIAIADQRNADKGAVGMVYCGSGHDFTDAPFEELGHFRVVTKAAKGKLSGISIWSAGPQHIGTCKYKFKRVDTTDPGVPIACP